MIAPRILIPILAGLGLSGCVVGPPQPVYYAPRPGPVYVAPPPGAYVAPRPRRVWVPRRCDRYGRCFGGYWR